MSDVEVLNGPRVTLRTPTLDDAELLFERLTSDPEVPRYMSWRPHPDVGETRRVITEIFKIGGETTWLIELNDVGGPIGTCGWRRPAPHVIDFGYNPGRPWWRQGIMTEFIALLLDKARHDPRVYRVSAYCHVDPSSARPGLADWKIQQFDMLRAEFTDRRLWQLHQLALFLAGIGVGIGAGFLVQGITNVSTPRRV